MMARGIAGGARRKTCVVIFASEDAALARAAVQALRSYNLDAWFSDDINHGDWEIQVRGEIEHRDALIPIVTRSTRDKTIFIDEWRYAASLDKPIFPFVIDPAGTPFGMGRYSRTDAPGWVGDANDAGFSRLVKKLVDHFGADEGSVARLASIAVGVKSLLLPSFVFSLSSFETQLDPINGLELLAVLEPAACLLSAYDASAYANSRNLAFRRATRPLSESRSVVFLDSGNYEAARKKDYHSTTRPEGWQPSRFWKAAITTPADLVFSYDHPDPKGPAKRVADHILESYLRDLLNTGLDHQTLCPIVHLPSDSKNIAGDAASIVAAVAKEVRPTFVAIPERELGDGLLNRMRAVRAVRRALDDLGFYQPLHLLGTGNPITIAALAVCGADSFDGLEWCRTAANFETNTLLHFHQFDVLRAAFAGRIKSEAARSIVNLEGAPFRLRASSYNYDYFAYWMEFVQHWVHSPQPEWLFQSIPYIGPGIAEECKA